MSRALLAALLLATRIGAAAETPAWRSRCRSG
jgi:hypothetical protein